MYQTVILRIIYQRSILSLYLMSALSARFVSHVPLLVFFLIGNGPRASRALVLTLS